jgi:hypothetical protein
LKARLTDPMSAWPSNWPTDSLCAGTGMLMEFLGLV